MYEVIKVTQPQFEPGDIARAKELLDKYWLTQGKEVTLFEDSFSKALGVKHSIAINSGSSANYLMLSALIEDGTLKKGDRIAVPALAWITSIAPIIQLGLVPVFTDVYSDGPNIFTLDFSKVNTDFAFPIAFAGFSPKQDSRTVAIDGCNALKDETAPLQSYSFFCFPPHHYRRRWHDNNQ